jgi:hypothetical protein
VEPGARVAMGQQEWQLGSKDGKKKEDEKFS